MAAPAFKPGKKGGKKGPPVCFHCGKEGHISRECIEVEANAPAVSEAPLPISEVPYVDTHCHIDYILERARVPTWGDFEHLHPMPSNFDAAITVFCDSTSILSDCLSQLPEIVVEQRYPHIYGAVGLHPHNARHWSGRMEERIVELVTTYDKVVAWGEIGLDCTSEKKGAGGLEEQMPVFVKQLQLATALTTKPLVIHYRGDPRELLQILEKEVRRDHPVHLHSWGSSDAEATAALLNTFPNLYVGFTGNVTFQGPQARKLRGMIEQAVPIDRFVLETDSPYMLPAVLSPGKKQAQPLCHPGHIPYIAQEMASIFKTDLDTIFLNARGSTAKLYGI